MIGGHSLYTVYIICKSTYNVHAGVSDRNKKYETTKRIVECKPLRVVMLQQQKGFIML